MVSETREGNIEVFHDTLRRCREDARLREAVERSISGQRVNPESEGLDCVRMDSFDTAVLVSKTKSLTTARKYAGGRTAVLNFANWYKPGGGVERGHKAQEENLCRCSTLYPCISDGSAAEKFYRPHSDYSSSYANDDVIYTPGVIVFKDDSTYEPLYDGAFTVDVITCAAPDLRYAEMSDDELYDIHFRRFSRILEVAHHFGDVNVILGAFGCGAFQNDPEVVASAAEAALRDWKGCFKVVDFAVHTSEYETRNYRAFSGLAGLFGH